MSIAITEEQRTSKEKARKANSHAQSLTKNSDSTHWLPQCSNSMHQYSLFGSHKSLTSEDTCRPLVKDFQCDLRIHRKEKMLARPTGFRVALPEFLLSTFKSVNETLVCDYSNESYCAVLSCGTVYYTVQVVLTFTSVDKTLVCDHSNESY